MTHANPYGPRAGLLLASILVVCGCESGRRNPVTPGAVTPSSQFTGIFLGGYEAGVLSISIATADLAPPLRSPGAADTVVTAYGTMSLDGGQVVNLAGNYDSDVDSLHLAGQGWTLDGRYYPTTSPPVLDGSFSGPNGSGLFGCWPGNTGSVGVFCGKFESTRTPVQGRWNLAVTGGAMIGLMAPDGASEALGFSGNVTGSGTMRALSFSSGWTDPLLFGDGEWNTATDTVNGTWTYGTDSGTWEGEACLSGNAGPN